MKPLKDINFAADFLGLPVPSKGSPDLSRSALSFGLGVMAAVFCWEWLGFTGKIAFLAGWILSLAIYLVLLGIVIFQADGLMTKQRVSRDQPNRFLLLILLIILALIGNICIGVILTSVGSNRPAHARLLVGLSVWAVTAHQKPWRGRFWRKCGK